MALFPITGYYRDDFIAHLIAADTDDTMDQVAAKIAGPVLGKRLPAVPQESGFDVFVDDELVEPSTTLGELGLRPLHWVDVRPRS